MFGFSKGKPEDVRKAYAEEAKELLSLVKKDIELVEDELQHLKDVRDQLQSGVSIKDLKKEGAAVLEKRLEELIREIQEAEKDSHAARETDSEENVVLRQMTEHLQKLRRE